MYAGVCEWVCGVRVCLCFGIDDVLKIPTNRRSSWLGVGGGDGGGGGVGGGDDGVVVVIVSVYVPWFRLQQQSPMMAMVCIDDDDFYYYCYWASCWSGRGRMCALKFECDIRNESSGRETCQAFECLYAFLNILFAQSKNISTYTHTLTWSYMLHMRATSMTIFLFNELVIWCVSWASWTFLWLKLIWWWSYFDNNSHTGG